MDRTEWVPKVVYVSPGSTLLTTVFRENLSDGSVVFVAQCAARRGCMAHGDSVEEALSNLEESRVLWDAPDVERAP